MKRLSKKEVEAIANEEVKSPRLITLVNYINERFGEKIKATLVSSLISGGDTKKSREGNRLRVSVESEEFLTTNFRGSQKIGGKLYKNFIDHNTAENGTYNAQVAEKILELHEVIS
jgi:hypothetical protein